MKQAQNLIIFVAGIASGEANMGAGFSANVLGKSNRDLKFRRLQIKCPVAHPDEWTA